MNGLFQDFKWGTTFEPPVTRTVAGEDCIKSPQPPIAQWSDMDYLQVRNPGAKGYWKLLNENLNIYDIKSKKNEKHK